MSLNTEIQHHYNCQFFQGFLHNYNGVNNLKGNFLQELNSDEMLFYILLVRHIYHKGLT